MGPSNSRPGGHLIYNEITKKFLDRFNVVFDNGPTWTQHGLSTKRQLLQAALALLLGAGSSAQESYTDPTTAFVASMVDVVRLKSPHKNCSQAVQSFQSESGS